jgi:hypothetical protein
MEFVLLELIVLHPITTSQQRFRRIIRLMAVRQFYKPGSSTSGLGHLHALPRRSVAVRFTPVSGIDSRSQALPSRAKTGLLHRSKARHP